MAKHKVAKDTCRHCSEEITPGSEHYSISYVYPGVQISAQKERDKYHTKCWLKIAGTEFSVVESCPSCLQFRKHKRHKICWVCFSGEKSKEKKL